ncbi:MAG: TPM domain-containing protein, partial [Planctomycetota bacterium]
MKAIWTVGLLLAALAFAPLDAAWAQAKAWRPVSDDINFFSARAREQADQRISEIKSKFHKDLFIEAKNAPLPATIKKDDKASVNQFYDRLAEKRFEELRENGIYVMIIDDAHILRVVVGNNTIAKGYFTKANRDELIGLLRTKLHDKDHDGALLAGTKFVYDTMLANHPGGVRKADMVPVGHPVGQGEGGHNVRPAGGFNWSPILTIALVGVGVWVLFAIVRSLFRGASGGGAPGMG